MGVASPPSRKSCRSAASQAERFLPLESISSSTVAKKLGSTAPLYPDDRIDGQMYDDLHTAGVFPSCAAVSFTAAVSILRRSVTPSTASPCRRARTLAQISVPAQVRKSLAEKLSPIRSLILSLIICLVMFTTLPS